MCDLGITERYALNKLQNGYVGISKVSQGILRFTFVLLEHLAMLLTSTLEINC